jgi:hypothetical protein
MEHQDIWTAIFALQEEDAKLRNKIHDLKHQAFRLERDVGQLEDFLYGEELDDDEEPLSPEVNDAWPEG